MAYFEELRKVFGMFRTLATSTIALIAGAAPLFAEVTPSQVWENLTDYYNRIGYEVVVGQENDGGDTLTLGDVVIKSPENEDYTTNILIPKVTLQQTGDANVRTVFDGDITADFTSPMPDADDMEVSMVIAMPGNEMISSGTPEDLRHDFTYPTMTLSVNFGELAEGVEMPLNISLTDLAGTQTTKLTEGTESVYDMTAAKLTAEFAADQPPSEDGTPQDGRIEGSFDVTDMVMKGSMITPAGEVDLTNDMTAALTAGLFTDGTFSSGPIAGSFHFSGQNPEGQPEEASGSFSAENSELVMELSEKGFSYSGNSGRTEAEVNVSSLPFPITYAADSASGAMAIPVLQSDTPQPFKFAYELAGLTLSDEIWDLFDADQQLPRDPASLAIDLDGDLLVNDNLFDPDFGQTLTEQADGEQADGDDATGDALADGADGTDVQDMPFVPQTLRIAKLALDAVGVTADVTGELDLSQNPQEPVGTIEGNFTGVSGLIDKLIAMGAIPQEQAMGIRMMLAMFAKPVNDDPDNLRTELEFREGGSIFANGQQVK